MMLTKEMRTLLWVIFARSDNHLATGNVTPFADVPSRPLVRARVSQAVAPLPVKPWILSSHFEKSGQGDQPSAETAVST